MRKDDSKIREHCKHTRNAQRGGGGRRLVNKAVRRNAKADLLRELQITEICLREQG